MAIVKSTKFDTFERKMSAEQAKNMVKANDHYFIVVPKDKKPKTKRETNEDSEKSE